MQRGMLRKLLCLSVLFLGSCANLRHSTLLDEEWSTIYSQTRESSLLELQSEELKNLPPAYIKPIIAIYPNSFQDLTGQRKSNSSFALFSSAITQAPDAFLIRAFKHAANGEFFKVVERVGLENLTKERQIIRTTRQDFEDDTKLSPLTFAGLLVQGGVVAYDTNLKTGGNGARYLGVGASRQYREDTVTVSLRLISVSTGEVLMEVLTSKTILSVGLSQDVFKFIEMGTELIEIELGVAQNESVSIALQKAIETSVLEIAKLGIDRGYWKYE
ncbi:MAG: hypothetical protein CMI74_08520 [Candidatus Pelagibacter sp.]|nr:hypothetical protein [Candidatus Pelagibacter sp.]